MSTQKDTKKASGEEVESGNIKAYTKAKLSGKNVCRQTVKPITWRLKEDTEGLGESIMPYPRVFLFFTLYGSVIQDYLNNYESDTNGRHLTVDDVLKVLTCNDLADEGGVERHRDYDYNNKGCNPDTTDTGRTEETRVLVP